MQEQPRLSLLNILQKSLKIANKKTYIHRVIYIGAYAVLSKQDSRLFQLIFESNIKLINDEYADVSLTGFGLFYDGYIINIIEGPEDTTVKHLKTLMESLQQNLPNAPTLDRFKILLISHHIIKRFFFNWFGRPAKPPVLLEKIEPTRDPEDTLRQIHTCIKKLYRMSEYLSEQPVGLLRATMDNISEVCQQYLPEFNLLEFLLTSPALPNVYDYIAMYGTVPEIDFMPELIWPIPCDFVPYNIIGEDKSKALIYTPEEEMKDAHTQENELAEEAQLTNEM